MLKSADGATFEYELKETEAGFGGWLANYTITRENADQTEPELRFFKTKSDALGWLVGEATAHGFAVKPGELEPETFTISIYFGAPAYQDEPEGREQKAELEKEFGQPGKEASIGTGAEGPGIVFLVDLFELFKHYGGWALFLLTQGKDITEVVTFYIEGAKKLAKYVQGHLHVQECRPPTSGLRHGNGATPRGPRPPALARGIRHRRRPGPGVPMSHPSRESGRLPRRGP